tara:strand:+ start:353 stop:907 length:555 start_codon:yes stop_codon:yes gene_type:complete
MKTLRYITGRGGSGKGGLSAYLATLSDDYDVLPIDPDFLALDIQAQVDTVRAFTQLEDANLIANSYGAYLLLLALIDQPPLKIRVLLLSPVLGRAISEERMLLSRPPREKTLHKAIAEQRLGIPDHLEIVTGGEDEICDPALARQVGKQMGINVSIFPNEGHMLESSSVKGALNRFLPTEGVRP